VAEAVQRRHESGTVPRISGAPRPVSDLGETHGNARTHRGGKASTRKVDQVLWEANAAAKSGAGVETDPSNSPASPGCPYRSTNKRRAV
jgi:hypothetical protein